jgi:hypothetical protein
MATGSEIVQLARRHIGEEYVLGALAPKNNPRWRGPWDCAEFASWLVYQVAETVYGCDVTDPATADAWTGYWERDAGTKGLIVSVDRAAGTRGAAVLRVPQPGAIGHVVISDGAGGTIEAHSTARGVIASTLSGRRWDMGILVPGIDYVEGGGDVDVAPSRRVIYRLTDPPMTGSVVREIQRRLKALGFDPGGIDGTYGPLTQGAVVSFQADRGLVVDGEVGPETARRLGVTLPLVDQ